MDYLLTQVLTGTILGDGHLIPLNKKGESQLLIKHDDKALTYIKWLSKRFSCIGVNKINKVTMSGYHQHYFSTKQNLEIGNYRKMFYPNGIKIVPLNIGKLITHPIALAVWYMDDGSVDFREKYHKNATLATFGFGFEGCELLSRMMKTNFSLSVSVHKSTMRSKEYYRLYIKSESMKIFFDLIRQYMLPCYNYKIP